MRERYVRLNLWALLLMLRMTRFHRWGAVCVPSTTRVSLTRAYVHVGGLLGHTGGACSVFNNPSTPFRETKKKEEEKEPGPVQMHYSKHLEDSEEERWGGRKVGHNVDAVGARSLTLRLSNMITASVAPHNPTSFNSVCQRGAGSTRESSFCGCETWMHLKKWYTDTRTRCCLKMWNDKSVKRD